MNTSDADIYMRHAAYCNGIADNIRTFISQFGGTLTPDAKDWLYREQKIRREEAIENLEQCIEALKEESGHGETKEKAAQ